MRQSWILLLSVGCLGTRDVVPRWVTDASDGSLEEEEEIAEAKCGDNFRRAWQQANDAKIRCAHGLIRSGRPAVISTTSSTAAATA